MPPYQLPVFETSLQKRGRVWRWSVCTVEGQAIMLGVESRRAAARYKANRALFQMLLCAPYLRRNIGERVARGRRQSHSSTMAVKPAAFD
jgi:hypothetical protein